MRAEEFAD
jgi:hypothetical protein